MHRITINIVQINRFIYFYANVSRNKTTDIPHGKLPGKQFRYYVEIQYEVAKHRFINIYVINHMLVYGGLHCNYNDSINYQCLQELIFLNFLFDKI